MSDTCVATSKPRSGIISIMVTMIMMIVISLIVLGFAQISRRETTNSLDSQLSTQAYYAAESGINDARAAISGIVSSGGVVQPKISCANDVNYNFSSTISAANNVSYTCVLIDPAPPQLVYSVSSTPTVAPIFPTASLGTLNLSWAPAAGELGSQVTNCTYLPTQLPTTSNWKCPYPMLRVDLVPTNGPLTRGSLEASTMTVFFQPMNSGVAGVAHLNTSRGDIIPASCNAVSCSAKIDNVGGLTSAYLRVSSIYKNNSRLTITASNPNAKFSNAEAFIDVTGKAQDVLRRVVVAVDLTTANTSPTAPAALVTSDSVCKRFGVGPGGLFGVAASFPGDGGNPLCLSTGGGGGGGGGGDSGLISDCGNPNGCPSGGGNPFPIWQITVYVNKTPANAISCEWVWGDGSTTPRSGAFCIAGPGSATRHTYPKIFDARGNPVCKQYISKMVFQIAGGGTIESNSKYEDIPWGSDRSCPNP